MRETNLRGSFIVLGLMLGTVVLTAAIPAPSATAVPAIQALPPQPQLTIGSTAITPVPFDQVCGAGFNYCNGGGGGSVRALMT